MFLLHLEIVLLKVDISGREFALFQKILEDRNACRGMSYSVNLRSLCEISNQGIEKQRLNLNMVQEATSNFPKKSSSLSRNDI